MHLAHIAVVARCLLAKNEVKKDKAIKCKTSPGCAFSGNGNLDLPICTDKH